jgi:hypothetical protein
VTFLEPHVEPSPLRPLLFVGRLLLAVLARWRAIILAFILCLTLWLAVQVLLFASTSFWYLHDNLPKAIHIPPVSLRIPRIGLPSILPSRPITNCWRDRSLAGDCFKPEAPRRQSPPARLRASEPPPPPCARFRVCKPTDI